QLVWRPGENPAGLRERILMGPEESKGDLSEGDINLSSRRAEWVENNLDAETRRLLEEDSRLFLHQSLSTPCLDVLKSCDGIHLENLQGRRLMDFHGNNVHQVGFSHPRVLEAVKAQLDKLSFCTRRYTNLPAIELARALSDRAPGDLDRVLLCPGGTGAMGMALKLARCATGRYKTISMWDSFHGASLDTISIGGRGLLSRRHGAALERGGACPTPRLLQVRLGLWG
ncbi:MAG: aminotransferase class III-fold pyridoxal phosphate-dependent enzyme, partial [Planctomycetota bacterium]